MKNKKFIIALLSILSLSGFAFAAETAPAAPAAETVKGEEVVSTDSVSEYKTKYGKVKVSITVTGTVVKVHTEFTPDEGVVPTFDQKIADVMDGVKRSLVGTAPDDMSSSVLAALHHAFSVSNSNAASTDSIISNISINKSNPQKQMVDADIKVGNAPVVRANVSAEPADGGFKVAGTVADKPVDVTVSSANGAATVNGTIGGTPSKGTVSVSPISETQLQSVKTVQTNANGTTTETTVVNNGDGTNTATVVDKDSGGNIVAQNSKTSEGTVANAAQAETLAAVATTPAATTPSAASTPSQSAKADTDDNASSSKTPDNSQVLPEKPTTGDTNE